MTQEAQLRPAAREVVRPIPPPKTRGVVYRTLVVPPARLALDLLHHIPFRVLVARTRYWYYARVRKRMRFLREGPGVSENTVHHNARSLERFAAKRSNFLVRPLSVLEGLPLDARILSVGPRNEGELLILRAHGFANVRGVDLMSYSPWIDLGDMHDLPYEDGSWDAVVLGWVLAYSDDKGRAAREIVRVVRDGGLVAVGVEYAPPGPEEETIRKNGYFAGSRERIYSVADILRHFEPHVGEIHFRQDVSDPARGTQLLVIFRVKKTPEESA